MNILVRLCPRPSVRLSHRFDNVPVIVSAFGPDFRVSGRFKSQMALKWCIKLRGAWERCPIVCWYHPFKFKVTRDESNKSVRLVPVIKYFRFVLFQQRVVPYAWLRNSSLCDYIEIISNRRNYIKIRMISLFTVNVSYGEHTDSPAWH